MKTWKSVFKEIESNDIEDETPSVSKAMSTARTYLLKISRLHGFQQSRALLAIDDVLLLFNVIMTKKTYDSSMSKVVNKMIDILRKKWGVE
jgi:hypothetical protein